MKLKILLVLSILFYCLILCGVAEFTPDLLEYDFGEIYEKDGEVEYRFEFSNTGDEPLKLIDVHAS
jgi:hypothetical protein